jgi:hypothetical protein
MIVTIIGLLFLSLAQSIIINSFILMMDPGMILYPLKKQLDKIFINRRKIGSKWRNEHGLLIIGKPIAYCHKCMPSIWSLPLLFYFNPLEVFLVAIFSVYISEKLYQSVNY